MHCKIISLVKIDLNMTYRQKERRKKEGRKKKEREKKEKKERVKNVDCFIATIKIKKSCFKRKKSFQFRETKKCC
jgi:hypothetical protein